MKGDGGGRRERGTQGDWKMRERERERETERERKEGSGKESKRPVMITNHSKTIYLKQYG